MKFEHAQVQISEACDEARSALGKTNLVNRLQKFLYIPGQLFDKSVYYPPDMPDLMLNFAAPVGEKVTFIVTGAARISIPSSILQTAQFSFHFSLCNLPRRWAPVGRIRWVTHWWYFGHVFSKNKRFRCLTNSGLELILNEPLLKKKKKKKKNTFEVWSDIEHLVSWRSS